MSTVIQASTAIDLVEAAVARGSWRTLSDRAAGGQLVERARAEGLQLTGEGGLLQQLTKRVLESALEGEITDHLGYDKHDPAGQRQRQLPQRHPRPRRC